LLDKERILPLLELLPKPDFSSNSLQSEMLENIGSVPLQLENIKAILFRELEELIFQVIPLNAK
jgi:hypothetical protein